MKYLVAILLFVVGLYVAPMAQPQSRMSLDQIQTDKAVKIETKINANRAWFVEMVLPVSK